MRVIVNARESLKGFQKKKKDEKSLLKITLWIGGKFFLFSQTHSTSYFIFYSNNKRFKQQASRTTTTKNLKKRREISHTSLHPIS